MGVAVFRPTGAYGGTNFRYGAIFLTCHAISAGQLSFLFTASHFPVSAAGTCARSPINLSSCYFVVFCDPFAAATAGGTLLQVRSGLR